ncbi:hypothetical protein MUK42_19059 [Musa troglodytarum]|uniref:phosphogluconate dehydrogenase (NADP(+)-dependent, decarboxylating) n=1 Tax=Musa troglodytarum TaxID=320322 RepID=A0A9E7JKW0_9LILI|nr:hypothetical protein MUK42_19059 [Musa troglodytarum]
MVHNGIEYRDMQLIAESYDITADTFGIKDDKYEGYLVDKVLDKTRMKGTGKWTIQQAAEYLSVAVQLQHLWIPGFSVDSKKNEFRLPDDILGNQRIDKAKLIEDVRFAQGMNLIRAMSIEMRWELKLGELARIPEGACIICVIILDLINKACDRNPELTNRSIDPEFAKEILD